MANLITRSIGSLASVFGAVGKYFSTRHPGYYNPFTGSENISGTRIDEFNAFSITAYYAAIDVISSSMSALPIKFYKMLDDTGGKQWLPRHKLSRLVCHPNGEMTAAVWKETTQSHCLGWGNGYGEIIRDPHTREPTAVYPILPNQIWPYREDNGSLAYAAAGKHGMLEGFWPDDIFHIPALGFDGIKGYSPAETFQNTLGLTSSMERFGSAFFGNGAVLGGFLTYPGKLTDKARAHLRKSFEEAHTGPNKARRLAVFDRGLTYTAAGVNPDDGQFLQSRAFQILELARMFRMPPHLLRDMSGAGFSNLEEQSLEFIVYTLGPWIVKWEQELGRKFLSHMPWEERYQYGFEIDVWPLMRGALKTRYEAYSLGRQNGWLSINDIRKFEGMNPLPDAGANEYTRPANLQPATPSPQMHQAQNAPNQQPLPSGEGQLNSEGSRYNA